ncbi:CHY zinc finger protein [Bacillus sp. FJAT-44742]|uniref:CHY zinc finger protein n=1 Tax=Bacillus sp. FJAT-44742 TaxID=2014005 RepID=UPI001E32C2CF|nr:CHY zinc finger protein [Bacillus sp. FJAT-44742]
MNRLIHGKYVTGTGIDHETRCSHYCSEIDIIALKCFKCLRYFSCFLCHHEHEDHQFKRWPKAKFDHQSVMCGACGREMSTNEYLESGSRCPSCYSAFNPGCKRHAHLYFHFPNTAKKE